MKTLRTSVGLLAATFATAASASSDGTLGPTSSGTFTVNAAISSVAANVQVSGLQDFSFFGNVGGTINSHTNAFCVIREGSGEVGLTISSFNAADTYFRVTTPGGADEIQMLFTLISADPGFESVPLTEGTETTFIAPSVCPAGGDRGLTISLLNTSTAAAGNYANSFLVTVSPK